MTEARQYTRSEALLQQALEVIPLGAQTFSKSITQYPRGVSPFFIERARGSRTWDVDGNEYVDFVNSLAAVTLGHCDEDITRAVSEQLTRGTIFSLSSELEIEVARLIVEMVPCAEKVRFGKNGSDATAGAVRAARAFTGRDRVAVCGYHGWQDWYIGSTGRNKGVPQATRDLTSTFRYNDLGSLEALLAAHPGEIAAIILEPMNLTWPESEFLEGVVKLGRSHGAIVVFDETITGFRYALGGAQEYFGVTPDLACFGKGLANGYPLSAVAGRADVMAMFEEVFFSFTMGGELLSLAAAKASLEKARSCDVSGRLAAQGQKILAGVSERIERFGCQHWLAVSGHPSWSFLTIADAPESGELPVKTLFLQEVFARGILTLGTHNLSYAHEDQDIERLLAVYDEVLPMITAAIAHGIVRDKLHCDPLRPLFRVR